MKKRILFIQDPGQPDVENVLDSMDLPADWELDTLPDPSHSLECLAEAVYDAVIVDTPLTSLENGSVLKEITARYPQMLRFVLSDFGDGAALMHAIGTAHHCMPKPVRGTDLKRALAHAFEMELWLTNENVRRLLGHMRKLPSPPSLYFKVVRLIQSPDSSLDEIGDLIASDAAMTAKLLQAVNSPLFGLQRRISGAQDAVLFLGLEITRSLILLAHSFSYFDHMEAVGFSVDKLWRHSITTAKFARTIAAAESSNGAGEEEAFTAGLLHDLGKLAFAANQPEQYGSVIQQARSESASLWRTELEVFGASHAEIGAAILAVWGIPLPIVESVALHHKPMILLSPGFSPLTAVHVANNFAHLDLNHQGLEDALTLNHTYLKAVQRDEQLPLWLERCRDMLGAPA